MVQETSIESYQALIDSGELGVMQEKVFKLIHDNPFKCDREYAQISGLNINQITGRRNDLVNEGVVIDAGTTLDEKTGRTVLTWEVPKIFHFKKKAKRNICPHCNGKGYVLP